MNFKVWSMFLFRVVLGAVFVFHGWDKIQHIEGVVGYFGSLGLAPFFAYAVAYIELLAGALVLLGIYSRWAALLLAVVMVGAVSLAKFKFGFLNGYEYELTLLVGLLVVAFNGAGPYSLSGKMCGCGNCAMCGMR